LPTFKNEEHVQTDGFGLSSQVEMRLMGPAVSTVTFPMLLEGAMDATSILANLLEESDWIGRLSRISNWNDSLTIAEDLLEFLVVRCERSNFFGLAFREADLDTF
jgi:hypothetical protein